MYLPDPGTKFVVVKLESTAGFLISDRFMSSRKLGPVIYKGFFPGHGGDVWACEHPDGTVGAYCFTEVKPFSNKLAQKFTEVKPLSNKAAQKADKVARYQRKLSQTKSKSARKRLASRLRKYANSI